MQTRTIIATAGGGLATCAALVFAVYQAQGRQMSDGVETLVLIALFFGGFVFVAILAVAGLHGGAQAIHWSREHIRFQNRWPIRYRKSGEPSKPPIINEFTGVNLGALEATDPYITITALVYNFSGEPKSLRTMVGRIRCAGELCNDAPYLEAEVHMGPSYHDRYTIQIHQKITKDMVKRLKGFLAVPENAISLDFNYIQIEGSYLFERSFILRAPIIMDTGSPDLSNMYRWSPIIASQTYYTTNGVPITGSH